MPLAKLQNSPLFRLLGPFFLHFISAHLRDYAFRTDVGGN